MDPGILVASVAGVVGTAAILRYKRQHAEAYLAEHGPLPGPATSKAGGSAAPRPTGTNAPVNARGFSRYLVQQGTPGRDIDMGRVTRDGRVTPHWGRDIGAPVGTPAYAPKAGLVTWARPTGTFGNVLAIGMDDGMSAVYVHLDRILVSQGQRVAAGQHVANTGNTGTSRGPHLHFEIQRGAQPPDLRSSSRRPLPNRNVSPSRWLADQGIEPFATRYRPGGREQAAFLDYAAIEGDALAGYAQGLGDIGGVLSFVVPAAVVVAVGAVLLEGASHVPKRDTPW